MKKKITLAKPKAMQLRKQPSLYDKDFYKWSNTQANYLLNMDFSKLDIENLVEEIESLGNSNKLALKSHLINLLMHMLKTKYQSEKTTKSWKRSIINARVKIELIVDNSPSLKREIPTFLEYCYSKARKKAIDETNLSEKTFPVTCPWELKEIL